MTVSIEDLKSVLKYAILAPSSHNTQPWKFAVYDNNISLYADRGRALPINDSEDRELAISCGCALMNLRVAAAHFGFHVNLHLLPDPEDSDLLATIKLGHLNAPLQSEVELFQDIENRRTYRKHFQARAVPISVQERLCEIAAQESAWLHIVEAKVDRRKIAALVAEGDTAQWANPRWRRELAAWMHPRHRGDGLVFPSPLVPLMQFMVRTFNVGSNIAKKNQQLVNTSSMLAVLGTADDTPLGWLIAGQALERVLLKAHSYGLQASFLNQPIEVTSIRQKLEQLLRHDGFSQIILRFGFPEDELPAVPRRHLNDVIDIKQDNGHQ